MDGWLLFIHQLPPAPAYLRVKVSRRLARIGAAQLKSTVYVLPKQADCYEDFQWLRGEILADGGEATICEARFLDGHSDHDVVALFHHLRDPEYLELKGALDEAATRLDEDDDLGGAEAELNKARRRLAEIDDLDFFGAPMKKETESALAALDERVSRARAASHADVAALDRYRRRTWVTREKMKVDRLSSTWLIKRFIDPHATFKLVPAKGYVPQDGEVLFDMFEQTAGADARFDLFTHEGPLCTFEVLLKRLGVNDPALGTLGEIIHDIDVKDAHYARPEAAGFAALIDGICAAHDDDDARLARASSTLDDLYTLFSKRSRGGG